MRKYKKLWIIASMAALLMVLGAGVRAEWEKLDTVSGVEKLSEDTVEAICGRKEMAQPPRILMDGLAVPYDADKDTYYIYQNMENAFFQGNITVSGSYHLGFLEDSAFLDKGGAVAAEHVFSLYVYNEEEYASYSITFTGMPILSIYEEDSYMEEEDEVLKGYMNVFQDNLKKTDLESFQTDVTYHVRGNTSRIYPKKCYKLNLKTDKGNLRKASLLNMREDDDWILNAMYTDQTKMCEKLTSDLWNEIQDENGTSMKMSRIAYTEVFFNDTYWGLYALQEPVDAKQVNLNEANEFLFKVKANLPVNEESWLEVDNETESVGPYFLTEQPAKVMTTQVWNYIHDFSKEFYQPDYYLFDEEFAFGMIDEANQIDAYLLCEYARLSDSTELNNMYYYGKLEENGYVFYKIFWDNDASFCRAIIADGTDVTNYEFSKDEIEMNFYTKEMTYMLQFQEDMPDKIYERWSELKEGVFAPEKVKAQISKDQQYLLKSGALYREDARWDEEEVAYETEYFHSFIDKRTAYLEEFFYNMKTARENEWILE